MIQKKKKSDNEIIIQDMEFAKSTKSRIKHLIIKILKQKPLLNEQDLLAELYLNDKIIKAYLDSDPKKVTYLRYIVWEMAKRGEILKVKIIGDMRRAYYILPSQIQLFKDRIVKIPKKWKKLIETQNKPRGVSKDEDELEDELDEWEEE